MRKNKKRLWALLVSAALMAAQLPAARAAEGPEPADSVEKGDFIVEGAALIDSQEGGDFYLDGDVLHITSGKAMTIRMKNGVTATTDTILVPSSVTASVTLQGVNIDVSGTDKACAFAVEAGGEANVTLAGANTLKSGRYRAGLEVPENATLTLTGGDGDSLEATGGV